MLTEFCSGNTAPVCGFDVPILMLGSTSSTIFCLFSLTRINIDRTFLKSIPFAAVYLVTSFSRLSRLNGVHGPVRAARMASICNEFKPTALSRSTDLACA